MVFDIYTLLGGISFLAWLYLGLGHGLFWLPLLPKPATEPAIYPSVDIIVPARNEAEALPLSLPALLGQNYAGAWRIILVDDHSTDGTSAIATKVAASSGHGDRLTVIPAPDLPDGWSGKVAAMQAGVTHSQAELILFTDADIVHAPHSLRDLVAITQAEKLDLVSRMVLLNCTSFAEKLLIPAFVFFFAMLYPFRRANNPASRVAAAAGGTMLIRRGILDKIGGLTRIKSALIDDCSLARAVKDGGGRIQLTLTRDITSLRPYPHIVDVWQMVARTAYTQLRFSPLLLLGTMLGMILLYLVPPYLFLAAPTPAAIGLGLLCWGTMTVLYLPIIRFYRLNPLWALALPLAGLIYGMATIDSARLYNQGKGGLWKGRAQA